ncbi:hypothetical protein RJ55_06159 [Drechmeria coniospora]|nr:hypothetical protein RJ55_06159 [Drechmeria coniospora]
MTTAPKPLSYGICSPSAGLCRCRWEQESDQDTLEFMELFHGEKDGKKYEYQPVVWSVKPDVERYDLRPRDVIKEDCRHGLATSCQMSSEAMGNADCSEVLLSGKCLPTKKCDCTWKDRKEHALQYLTVEDKKNKYGDEPVWRWVDVAENPEPEQGSLTPRWRLTKEHDRVDTDCISAMFSTCQKQTILFGGAEDAGCLAACQSCASSIPSKHSLELVGGECPSTWLVFATRCKCTFKVLGTLNTYTHLTVGNGTHYVGRPDWEEDESSS